MTAHRHNQIGLIDRDTPLEFSWDGKPYSGYAGDSLASALLANGETIFARSFKYHRPRGVLSAGVEESGALVSIGKEAFTDANVRATTTELSAGMQARGQNAWPNVRFDLGAVNNAFGRFLAAGFYYKTFMGLPPFEWGRGTWLWMQYEKIIRKAAGMGQASRLPDPDEYEHGHLFCDVLVVGSGPAGMTAAINCAQQGLDVILVEQDWMLGGDLLNQGGESVSLRESLVTELESSSVRVMSRTTAFGLYDHGVAGLLERVTDHLSEKPSHLPRQRFWTLRAKRTILATGALERQYAFHNNDRPGVMNAHAARAYLNRYGVQVAEHIAVSTNNDSAYAAAFDLAAAGAIIKVFDARERITASLVEQCKSADIQLTLGSLASATLGGRQVSGAKFAKRKGGGWQEVDRLDCDSLLISGGWSPVVNLMSHRGVRPSWNAENACFVIRDAHEGIELVGSAAGCWQTQDCLRSGEVAAHKATNHFDNQARPVDTPSIGGWQTPIEPVYEVKPREKKIKAFVDYQHDVTTDDVRLAHREGFVSVEHLKRYTTLGMATDGGKMGNIIGLALMAESLGKEIPQVGSTVFRPPYTPIAIGALAGRGVDHHFKALRRTPLHDWNLKHGATMTMAGLWHRPWYFAREGESINEAYIRETITTRETVGLCDVTSLGKIAVQGPDATEFLNRIYTNPFAKLPIGKARYGIMLRDDGIVMDDGTTWRLSETDYFMTTTTVNAAKVMVWLEELLQTRWQDLRVNLTSVSEQWAGLAVAGPESRKVLSECMKNADEVSDENLPFMGVIESTLKNDIPCRIARISFSGERAFEVYVPSDYAEAMMNSFHAEAENVNGCLYGLEALGAMRIEKGHVTGAELDGRVTIGDAGLGKMASKKKSYIGSTLAQRPELQRDDRPQLVGIFPKNKDQKFNAGSLLYSSDKISGIGEGWITAVTHSPTLGHWIGLGFITGGHKHWEESLAVAADPVRSSQTEVEIVSPHMVDPSGERMYG